MGESAEENLREILRWVKLTAAVMRQIDIRCLMFAAGHKITSARETSKLRSKANHEKNIRFIQMSSHTYH